MEEIRVVCSWRQWGIKCVEIENLCGEKYSKFAEKQTRSISTAPSSSLRNTKISNLLFPSASLDCVFRSLFMKQLRDYLKTYEKSKASVEIFCKLRHSRHPCCASLDINSHESFFRACKWNSCSLEWRLIQLEKLCTEESVNCQRSFLKHLVTWQVIEPARELIFNAAFRHKSCGRTQSLHDIV